ncbi:MAG: DNA topoisomerase I, partial [Thermoleophilia bacterium]|nr:DNA topoisomerase I [Thermoleophilia bacterium]
MRLIITEKNNSADKISKILGGAPKADKAYAIPFYSWTDETGEEQVAIGLKGHVMNPAFPDEYRNWRGVDPRTLIDADLIKVASQKNVVKALKKLAKTAGRIVVATDFDREGELIGLEVLEELWREQPQLREGVTRARYSALTKEEIEHSFANLTELSVPLARAGEARQDIDLIWGATLTRFVSLAAGRLGSSFLSVGRVQSPTLMLIVERELERRAHVPLPFWEVFAEFANDDGSNFVAHHTTDRFMAEYAAGSEDAGEPVLDPASVDTAR